MVFQLFKIIFPITPSGMTPYVELTLHILFLSQKIKIGLFLDRDHKYRSQKAKIGLFGDRVRKYEGRKIEIGPVLEQSSQIRRLED